MVHLPLLSLMGFWFAVALWQNEVAGTYEALMKGTYEPMNVGCNAFATLRHSFPLVCIGSPTDKMNGFRENEFGMVSAGPDAVSVIQP